MDEKESLESFVDNNSTVTCRVGGKLFNVSTLIWMQSPVLQSIYKYGKEWRENKLDISSEAEDCVEIHRSSEMFEIIISFLENGKMMLMKLNSRQLKEFADEADFYCLSVSGLIDVCVICGEYFCFLNSFGCLGKKCFPHYSLNCDSYIAQQGILKEFFKM